MDAIGYLIRSCRLVDGVSEQVAEEADVYISDGRIRAIGRNLLAPEGVNRVDARGLTLLPGLIDTHVHLVFDASLDPVGHLLKESPYETLLKAARRASDSLSRGVTTVRDLGAPHGVIYALREGIRKGILPGPRIIASGMPITTTGGHCHFMGHEADNAEAICRAVCQEIDAGADVIKVMATGGALTPGSSVTRTQYRAEELAPAVRTAHERGLRVAAHANGLQGLREAVEARVDSIEHGSYADRAALERMAKLGIFLVPTMAPARAILEGPRSELVPAERRAQARRNWEARQQAVREAIRLGVPLASGTDAGVTLTDHGTVSLEIETFHELGLPPMQAIWTATRWAADLLGIGREVGTVEEGKQADLLLVEGNPLLDLTRLRHPRLVFKEGQPVERPARPWPAII